MQQHIPWVGLTGQCQSQNMKLQFNIYSLVKCSYFWLSVKTSEGPRHPQFRILVTVVI